MPIAAQCPNCGGPLSETSVLALAPVCGRCGTVITEIGGTLGLTSAYGVNDPTITRKRVEADLAVFCDYRTKYVGMLEACKEQLNWGVERYAKMPPQPELLPVVVAKYPSFGCALFAAFGVAILFGALISFIHGRAQKADHLEKMDFGTFISLVVYAALLTIYLVPYFKAKAANGKRPMENVRRQKAYEEAYAAALKAAEPVKAAQDHRLTVQIRELDGLIKTVTEKAEDVRRILRTL